MGDLNSRPPRPERGALPSCANPRAVKAYIWRCEFASTRVLETVFRLGQANSRRPPTFADA